MPSPPTARTLKPAQEGQPSKTANPRKRQSSARISAACEACKKRKTKCTGGPAPCQLCKSLGTECVIDLSLDMRRRAAFQRTLDESKSHQDALNSLLNSIRDGPSSRLDSLFDFIRSGATNEQINDAVNEHLTYNDEGDDIDDPTHDEADPGDPDGIESGRERADDSLVMKEVEVLKRGSFSSVGSIGSQKSAKGKELEVPRTISSLLASLKTETPRDGENMLRGFLATQLESQFAVPAWAPTIRSPVDGLNRPTNRQEYAKRSMWHPALRVAFESNWPSDESRSKRDESTHYRKRDAMPEGSQRSQNLTAATDGDTDVPMETSPASPSSTLPYVELIMNTSVPAGATSDWDLCVAQLAQGTQLRVPRHLILPLVISDDSTMSRTYTHYLQAARQMLQNGVPVSEILGPSDTVAVDIFFRPRAHGDNFDCASWACEISRSNDTDVFVRLASVFFLTHMMRWLLVPTLENYQRIPDMMKPTPSQCMIPHIGAIETIPLPTVRDAAIHRLRDWLTPLSQAKWSVNWPHDVDSAVEQEPRTGAIVLTASFMDHVSKYSNWSVGKSFLSAFPEVTGQIRIHESR